MKITGKFIGTGWAFPPAFTLGGEELVMVQDEQDIFESLQILLSTSLGERVLREDFGCNLRDYLFEELDNRLLANLRLAVTEAVRRHETRVNLEDVSFDVDANLEMATIFIRIGFVVRTTNTRYNLVYPFYLREATAVPGTEGQLAENLPPEIPPLTPADVMPRRTVVPDPEPEPEGPVFESFRHLTSAENTNKWTANYTLLDHPRLNGRPGALVFISPVWQTNPNSPSAGAGHPEPYEVLFTENRWAIAYRNPDLVMSGQLAFNVLIAPEGLTNAFVHTVTEENRHPNLAWAFVNHPSTTGNPEDFLLVTPRRGVAVSNRQIGLTYDGGRWIIFNQLGTEDKHEDNLFAPGEAYNVLLVSRTGSLGNLFARDHHVKPENQAQTGTALDPEGMPGHDGFVFFNLAWLGGPRGGVKFKGALQLWFDREDDAWDKTWRENHWIIYSERGPALPNGLLLFIFRLQEITEHR